MIDEDAEGEYLTSSSISVRTPSPRVSPGRYNTGPRYHRLFRVSTFVLGILLVLLIAFMLLGFFYFKPTSSQLYLQPLTANIISFYTNDTAAATPLNVTFTYLFYNPNSRLILDIRHGIADLDFGNSDGPIPSSNFRPLYLPPHGQTHVQLNFFAPHSKFRLDSYTNHIIANNKWYFEVSIKIRMRIYFLHLPFSSSQSVVQKCHIQVNGHPPTGSVPVETTSCQ